MQLLREMVIVPRWSARFGRHADAEVGVVHVRTFEGGEHGNDDAEVVGSWDQSLQRVGEGGWGVALPRWKIPWRGTRCDSTRRGLVLSPGKWRGFAWPTGRSPPSGTHLIDVLWTLGKECDARRRRPKGSQVAQTRSVRSLQSAESCYLGTAVSMKARAGRARDLGELFVNRDV